MPPSGARDQVARRRRRPRGSCPASPLSAGSDSTGLLPLDADAAPVGQIGVENVQDELLNTSAARGMGCGGQVVDPCDATDQRSGHVPCPDHHRRSAVDASTEEHGEEEYTMVNVTEIEIASIARFLAFAESRLPLTGPDGLVVGIGRSSTSVEATCGCGADLIKIARNVGVLRVTRCAYHGGRWWDEEFVVEPQHGGLCHLAPEGHAIIAGELRPPARAEAVH